MVIDGAATGSRSICFELMMMDLEHLHSLTHGIKLISDDAHPRLRQVECLVERFLQQQELIEQLQNEKTKLTRELVLSRYNRYNRW